MKDSFVVRFGVNLWLTSIGLTGPFGAIVGFFAAILLGSFLDRAIIKIDLTIDSLKQALKDDQWREAAQKAYDHASARVYTEEEKRAIRKEYTDALKNFATFGNGVSDNQHS